MNVWLRCANRVYLVLASGFATDFDDLYALAESVDWKKFRPKDAPILVESVTHKSALTSEPAVQRTVKKAIIESLVSRSGDIIPEMDTLENFRVLVLLRNDRATLLLDTSGDALHKRGYRLEAGEAPIKETLASAMIYLSNWRYKEPFLDPCCGSGTLPIEAAMIARNIAPGLRRHFAFEKWNWIDARILTEVRDEAKTKIYPPGGYQILAQDIDETVLEKALYNAKVAGVASDIQFKQHDILDGISLPATLLCNPPYGERLDEHDVQRIHAVLLESFQKQKTLSGGVITNEDSFIRESRHILDRRKIWNGSIECQFCFRKSERK